MLPLHPNADRRLVSSRFWPLFCVTYMVAHRDAAKYLALWYAADAS